MYLAINIMKQSLLYESNRKNNKSFSLSRTFLLIKVIMIVMSFFLCISSIFKSVSASPFYYDKPLLPCNSELKGVWVFWPYDAVARKFVDDNPSIFCQYLGWYSFCKANNIAELSIKEILMRDGRNGDFTGFLESNTYEFDYYCKVGKVIELKDCRTCSNVCPSTLQRIFPKGVGLCS